MKGEVTLPRGVGARKLGRVCTTISAKTGAEMVARAEAAFRLGTDLVEFRADLAEESIERMEGSIAPFSRKSIVTVRRREEGGGFRGPERQRLSALSRLSGLRPAYLDVELSTVKENPEWYAGLPRSVQKIISWHDFDGTPSLRELRSKRAAADEFGQVTKVVTRAVDRADGERLLRLYEDNPRSLIAFCMGPEGSESRLASLRLGAPVVYASLPGEPVAPGQPPVTKVLEAKLAWEKRR